MNKQPVIVVQQPVSVIQDVQAPKPKPQQNLQRIPTQENIAPSKSGFKQKPLKLEFNEQRREIEIAGQDVLSELRVAATKAFSIDAKYYLMLVEGDPVTKDVQDDSLIRL